MTNVLVLGNSHAGSLRMAVRKGWERPGFAFSFMTLSGRLQPRFRFEGTVAFAPKPENLMTDIEGAKTEGVDISRYNAVLLSAWGLPNGFEVFSGKTHPLAEARCTSWPDAIETPLPPISRALMGELIADRLRAQHAYETLQTLAGIFDGPIFVQPKPKPPENIFHDPEWMIVQRYGDAAEDVMADFVAIQEDVSLAILRSISPDIVMLPFPPSEPHSLPDLYNASKTDGWHKNSAYGGLVLDQLAEALSARLPS